jgi:hypothetical protein
MRTTSVKWIAAALCAVHVTACESVVGFRELVPDGESCIELGSALGLGTIDGRPTSVAAVDINDDGKQDLLWSTTEPAATSMLLNTQSGSSQTPSLVLRPSTFPGWGSLERGVLVDINQDRKPDFVTAGAVFLNTSQASILDPTMEMTSMPDLLANGKFVSGDLNGDGRPDIIRWTTPDSSPVANIHLNMTTANARAASFAPKVDITMGSALRGIQVADMNADGRLDLVMVSADAMGFARNVLSVLLNTTTDAMVSFAPKIDIWSGFGAVPAEFYIADLDNNGMPDIVITDNPSRASADILQNVTTPTASMVAMTRSSINLWPRVLQDLNDDGKVDLALVFVKRGVGSIILVRINTTPAGGTPQFASALELLVNATEVYSGGDWVKDGRADLVATFSPVPSQPSSMVTTEITLLQIGAQCPR